MMKKAIDFGSCPDCGLFQPQPALTNNLPSFFQAHHVPINALKTSRFPVAEIPYLALGGGLGSFAWVNYLRVCGVPARQIAAIGLESLPYARFRRLCQRSQISNQERLRSESGARPDNLWGWPGYALHEIVDLLWQHKWQQAGHIAWQIFSEPTLANTYAPTAQTVYKTVEREMKRIGWQRMFHQGQICAVRQTDDGRYATLYQPLSAPPRIIITPYLHLALGYPGLHLTPETTQYRQTYQDRRRVVQAYENHEHIYAQLSRQGGTVILRGRGIVASRILQQLDSIRRKSSQPIQVIHLLRSPATKPTIYGRASRRLQHHRQVQPFNWPKAAFGGDLRIIMETASPEQRQQLAAIWGNTTTSDRADWIEVVERAVKEGWYTFAFGKVTEIKPNGRHRLIIKTEEAADGNGRLIADYLIDCTGLNTQTSSQPILADLATHYRLAQNKGGGWAISANFEVKDLRNGTGQVFIAGISAAGNAFAPVDSFLGLQYAAQRSIEILIRENAPNLHPLKGAESIRQWWRWVNGQDPTPRN